jgi:hypothetical protein
MQATEVRRWVNPSMLIWARECMGLQAQQVEDLAKERGTEIKAGNVTAWKNSRAEPELSDLVSG